jgi:hypothetical protein
VSTLPQSATVTTTVFSAHACAAHSSVAGAAATAPPVLSAIAIVSAAVGGSAPSVTLNVAAAPDRLALTAVAPTTITRAPWHTSDAPDPPPAYPVAHTHAAAAEDPAGLTALAGHAAHDTAAAAAA